MAAQAKSTSDSQEPGNHRDRVANSSVSATPFDQRAHGTWHSFSLWGVAAAATANLLGLTGYIPVMEVWIASVLLLLLVAGLLLYERRRARLESIDLRASEARF